MCAGEQRQHATLVAGVAAGAGIHRGDEHEARREHRAARGAGDGDPPFLQRLAHQVEHVAVELGQLVEEQHAVVRQGDLARSRLRSAADERRAGDAVMRRPERPPRQQAGTRRQEAGHRVDGRAVERLVEGERRQDRRQPARQHRLARARRPAHQQVVPPGRGDFERPTGRELAVHVGEIGLVARQRRAAASAARCALRADG